MTIYEKKEAVVELSKKEKLDGTKFIYLLAAISEIYHTVDIKEGNSDIDDKFYNIAKKFITLYPDYFNFDYNQCIFPILRHHDEFQKKGCGTGCLVRYNSDVYIMTAAHVLTEGNPRPKIYLPIKGYHDKQIEDFSLSEEMDIAVLKLHKPEDAPYFFDISNPKGKVIERCVVGFRVNSYRAIANDKYQYKDTSHISCSPKEHQSEYQILGTFNIKNAYRGNSFMQQGPKLKGVSGGACIETCFDGSLFSQRFAGIFTDHDDKACEIRSTKIEAIADFIEKNYK